MQPTSCHHVHPLVTLSWPQSWLYDSHALQHSRGMLPKLQRSRRCRSAKLRMRVNWLLNGSVVNTTELIEFFVGCAGLPHRKDRRSSAKHLDGPHNYSRDGDHLYDSMFEDKQPANPSVQVAFLQIFGRGSIVKDHVFVCILSRLRRQSDKKLKLQLQGHKRKRQVKFQPKSIRIHPNRLKSF